MIFIKVRNGLGNQMFCYSFGEYLKQKNPNIIVKYDNSELPLSIEGRIVYDVNDIFHNKFEFATVEEIRQYCGKPYFITRTYGKNRNIIYKLISKINAVTRYNSEVVYYKEPDYWIDQSEFVKKIVSTEFDERKTYLFDGYWENMEYLSWIDAKEIFTFPQYICELKVINELKEENSVSVHVRRGDYLKNKDKPMTEFDLCGMDYYKSAIEIIESKVNNPHYYFFSDDISYVEDAFSFISNKTIVRGMKDYQDLYLMSICKHNIIANSTFSFWGAYLNKNCGIVIAPELHYIRKEIEREIVKKFFYIEGWIYLNNGPK